jgi:hypothetical protein
MCCIIMVSRESITSIRMMSLFPLYLTHYQAFLLIKFEARRNPLWIGLDFLFIPNNIPQIH